MAIHTLQREQLIKSDVNTVWTFFSNPRNLGNITPQYMNFQIITPLTSDTIFTKQIIQYRVSPILRLPVSWTTEISLIEPFERFIDSQKQGPFAVWHHEHVFTESPNGILMRDTVTYKLPLGFLGTICHALFIKRRLNDIFDFRYRKIEEIFNSPKHF